MEELPLKNIYPPEYYMEIEGYETRLAIVKIKDFLNTMGDANVSLTYCDKNEHLGIKDELELNVIRRIHLRHAIVDLNNSFDLLIQIPWFFFRIWNEFNSGGCYYNEKDKDYKRVVRNKNNWVEIAERNCSYKRVNMYLKNNFNDISNDLEEFKKKFIFNKEKSFTIRTLANDIKHNRDIKLLEFREPYQFNLNINGNKFNAKENKAYYINYPFICKDNKTGTKNEGEINFRYRDDLYVDIKYNNGEFFCGEDYVRKQNYHSIDEIFNEALRYKHNILKLYKSIFNILNPKICFNPLLNPTDIKRSKECINLDKYFKDNEKINSIKK